MSLLNSNLEAVVDVDKMQSRTALGTLGKTIDNISGIYCFIGMAAVFVFGFLLTFEAISKYFGYSTIWIYWGSIQVMALIPFFTAPYAMRQFQHVRVGLIENWMSPRTAIWSQLFGWFMFLVFCGVGTYYLFWTSLYNYRTGEIADIITIPTWWLYFLAGLGMLFTDLQIVRSMGILVGRLTPDLEGSKSVFGRPWLVIGLYAAAIIFSVWVFIVNPTAGVFLMLMVFLFTGIPVAAAIGFITVIALYIFGGFSYMESLGMNLYKAMEEFTWLAFPLFVMGGFMMQRGMATGLFKLMSNWIGWIPGGIAVAVIWTAVLLGAMLGSVYATLATLFILALPELDRAGYPRELTLPMLASSSVLGYLIPPSIILVLYGVLTEQSIGALFMAGILPGIALAVVFSVYVAIYSALHPEIKKSKASWGERFGAIPPNLIALVIPAMVIGTIITGTLTPTEAAAAAMVYVFIVNVFRGQQKLTLQDFKAAFYAGANVVGFLGILIVGALISKIALMQYHVANDLVSWVQAVGVNKLGLILMITFILFLMGCIGETLPVIIILIPTVFPVLYKLGFHPWWMCVYLVFIGGIGAITPPVGGVLFAMAGMANVDPYFIFRRITMWVILDLIAVAIMYIFPWLVTFIPYWIGFSPPSGF